MINIPPIKQSTEVKSEVITEVTRTWKVGQILNATTQKGGEALSNVLIRVGQHTIEAKTPIALQNGQSIQLLVKSLTENQVNKQLDKLPLLSIINTQPQITDTNKLAAIKLRQFIAIQQTFSQLQQFANNLLSSKNFTENTPIELKTLLNNLQQTLQLNIKDVSPAQLKQQIINSGVFLESRLLKLDSPQQTNRADSDSSVKRDFKYQLLTIKSAISEAFPIKIRSVTQPITDTQISQLQTFVKQSGVNISATRIIELTDKLVALLPKASIAQFNSLLSSHKPDVSAPQELQLLAKILIPTLQKQGVQALQKLQEQLSFRLMLLDLNQQVEQAISKVTSLQLQPVSREGDNLVLLLFNLVFKDSHERFDMDFRIQQENEKTEDNEESWLVTISFDFRTLGKVQSKIHLMGDNISNVFYTEFSATAEKIEQLLPLLESGLTNAGLNVLNLSVESNLPENNPFVSSQLNLLDENA